MGSFYRHRDFGFFLYFFKFMKARELVNYLLKLEKTLRVLKLPGF